METLIEDVWSKNTEEYHYPMDGFQIAVSVITLNDGMRKMLTVVYFFPTVWLLWNGKLPGLWASIQKGSKLML